MPPYFHERRLKMNAFYKKLTQLKTDCSQIEVVYTMADFIASVLCEYYSPADAGVMAIKISNHISRRVDENTILTPPKE